jgi:DNA-directed RNA polymerase subunit L
MSEVRLEPEVLDFYGYEFVCFGEDHTVRDILRYLLSTGVEASELIYHINDPTLLAELEGKECL